MIGTNIITIDEKEYHYSFTMGAFIEFQKATKSKEYPKGQDAAKLLNEFSEGEVDYEALSIFIYCALKYGMKREKLNFNLKLDDIIDALSDDTELINNMFFNISGNDLPEEVKDVEETDEKKNSK